ncbi:MAG: FecR family protein [Parasphingorhabdus sp.]|uniref:FecR family protein n=1 Tax=Parasphingorhabdus sp. TaxID=2709688 RepID=UPI0032985E44
MAHPITKSLIITALLSSSAAYAGTPGWQVSEISGNVTVARKGVIKIAQRQTKLVPGDVIKTGPKARAVLARGGEYLVVSPASHIEIAEPAKSGKVMQIIEYLGNVLFRIDKKETPHFGVKTPYMAAVVKGTTFSVSVSAEGSAVQVTEGAVEVSTLDEGASELITPGVIGMINANDPFSLVVIDGERRTIESPNKPEPANKGNVTTALKKPVLSPTAAGGDLASSDLSGVVAISIGEEGVELAELTNGLIRGDVSYNRFALIENAEESVGAGEDAVDSFDSEDDTASDLSDFDDDRGDDDQGDEDQGDEDQGDDNQGDEDQGDDEQGDDDQGDENQGDDGQGDDDQGDDGQGDEDQGDDDQGDDDQGDKDQGTEDQGDDDQGDDNQDTDSADTVVDIDLINQPDDDDDGNNGHGNDDDGDDDSNPGKGFGKGKGNDGDDDDDGNNGHGNDDDGDDDSNPGKGFGKGKDKNKDD